MPLLRDAFAACRVTTKTPTALAMRVVDALARDHTRRAKRADQQRKFKAHGTPRKA